MLKQNCAWTEQQDAAITMLYQQRHIEDWNEIARILNEEYNFPQKLPKHCKDRYTNHLNSSVFKIQWTEKQQQKFMQLHNQIGNKWATIAQHLHGKTDNCVKNHFYSKLRKLLRKLNKIIQFYLKKQFRPIDISVMYKIVEAAEERFKQKPNCQSSVSEECHSVENKMLQFAMFKDWGNENDNRDGDGKDEEMKFTESSIEEYKDLIRQIYRVSKLYKRKSKKVRNSLIQAPVNHAKRKGKKQPIKPQPKHSSQSQQPLYEPRQRVPTTILIRKQHDRQVHHHQQISHNLHQKHKTHNPNPNPNSRIQMQQGESIQALLRTAGILHDEVNPLGNNETKHRKSSMFSQYSGVNIPSPLMNGSQQNFFQKNNSSADYSPLHSFSSNQVENFLGFPMVNNSNGNNFANFTLSEKSSFKSYSQRDPSQIDNPFFDQYSSNNARMMFPMNFNLPVAHPYQQYSDQQFGNFQYNSVYYQSQGQQEEEGDSYIAEPKEN